MSIRKSIRHDSTLVEALDSYAKMRWSGHPLLGRRYLPLLQAMAHQWVANGGPNRLAALDVLWLATYRATAPALFAVALPDFYRWAGGQHLVDETPDLVLLFKGKGLRSAQANRSRQAGPVPRAGRPSPAQWPGGNVGQIQLVEDGAQVYGPLQAGLAAAGYTVTPQRRGIDALPAILTSAPVLVLLEAATDPAASLALCAAVRQRSRVPIILLLAVAPSALVIQAFECGADAIIGPDCTLPEVVVRIQALLRRTAMPPPTHRPISEGGMVLDALSYTVRVDTRAVKLTPTEYQLLRCLMDNSNQPMGRDQLYAAVWGSATVPLPSALEATMRRLRCKLEQDPSHPQYLRTVHGVGYQFVSLGCMPAAPPPNASPSPYLLDRNSLEISEDSGRV